MRWPLAPQGSHTPASRRRCCFSVLTHGDGGILGPNPDLDPEPDPDLDPEPDPEPGPPPEGIDSDV